MNMKYLKRNLKRSYKVLLILTEMLCIYYCLLFFVSYWFEMTVAANWNQNPFKWLSLIHPSCFSNYDLFALEWIWN